MTIAERSDTYAAVDLGSNSFHLLVARREHGELRVIDRIKEMVRLGGGLDDAGLDDLEHFLFRSDGGEPGSAVLSFSEDRKGLTSWLADPAPMGSLEFVSPQATLLVSAVCCCFACATRCG